MRNNDFYSSLVWLLVGLGFLGGGLKMGVGPMNTPGPGFFPVVIGATFSLLSLVLFLTALSRKIQPAEIGRFWKSRHSWKKVIPSLLSLVFYLMALNYLGYLVTTMLFIFYLLKYVGKSKWVFSISIALLLTVASYAVFRIALRVPLPRGVLQI